MSFASVRHTQPNGKVEWFLFKEDRLRWKFNIVDEFVNWYNSRLHGALWFEIGENQNEVFSAKNLQNLS